MNFSLYYHDSLPHLELTVFSHTLRSPGSLPYGKAPAHHEILFITLEDPPGVAQQLYSPQPGQVFLAEDVTQVEVWKVKALTGDIAWRQRLGTEKLPRGILRPHQPQDAQEGVYHLAIAEHVSVLFVCESGVCWPPSLQPLHLAP